MDGLKSKQSSEEKTREYAENELTWESLEKTIDNLSDKVKNLAQKNGFSKKLKKKVELELV